MKRLGLIGTLLALSLIFPIGQARGADYFVYSVLDTYWVHCYPDCYVNPDCVSCYGAYGVTSWVGKDTVPRVIFYKVFCYDDYCYNGGAKAYIYTVTVPPPPLPPPDDVDPGLYLDMWYNQHPSDPNPYLPGSEGNFVVPRTYTFERSFDLGVNPGHGSEFYVDAENDVIYLGASVGIRKYVFDTGANNYTFDSEVAPPSPTEEADPYNWGPTQWPTQSLAYDPATNTWYAGATGWNNPPGIMRKIWRYDGNQSFPGTWGLAFEYSTLEPTPSGVYQHHDGLEYVKGYLILADFLGNYILQYTPNGQKVNTFYSEPLSAEVEGMGFGAFKHFWVGSHDEYVTEFGGGMLQATLFPPPILKVPIDIKPGSDPNSINLKSKGNVPVGLLSSGSFDATQADRATVQLAGVAPLAIGQAPQDVNGDGLLDMVFHFDTQALALVLKPTDTEACLTGKTLAGQMFKGCDSVRILTK